MKKWRENHIISLISLSSFSSVILAVFYVSLQFNHQSHLCDDVFLPPLFSLSLFYSFFNNSTLWLIYYRAYLMVTYVQKLFSFFFFSHIILFCTLASSKIKEEITHTCDSFKVEIDIDTSNSAGKCSSWMIACLSMSLSSLYLIHNCATAHIIFLTNRIANELSFEKNRHFTEVTLGNHSKRDFFV